MVFGQAKGRQNGLLWLACTRDLIPLTPKIPLEIELQASCAITCVSTHLTTADPYIVNNNIIIILICYSYIIMLFTK